MAPTRSRLVAALAAAWEAEIVSARTLTVLSQRTTEVRTRARLLVLSAFCRAHAARLLARLSTLGQVPLPVPKDELSLDTEFALAMRREGLTAQASAARYSGIAQIARRYADTSSAWVCELNRVEEEDRATELLELADPSSPERLAEPTSLA